MARITVEPILLIYMLSTFMLYPALQDLIYFKVCLNNFKENVCRDLYNPSNKEALDLVQSHSSYWVLSSSAALLLPSMLSAQFLGSWSDIYGRKVPLLVPPLGGVFASFLYIGLSVYIQEWPIALVLFASFITGMCGGFVSCILTCMSYIAEITTLETRTMRVSILESTIFVGGSLGPLLTGWIIKASSRSLVFVVIMSLHTFVVLFIMIIIKDLPPRFQPDTRRLDGAYNVNHLKNSAMTLFKPRQEKGRKNLLLLIFSASFIMLCTIGEMDISYLYFIDEPFEWTMSQFTYFIALKNGLASMALLFILPLFRKAPDSVLILTGITSKLIGYLFFAFAKNSKIVYAGAVVALLNTWSVPVIRASMSKLVEPHEQGKMYACIAFVESCVGLVGTFIFNGLYPVTRVWFKGFIFIMEASMLLVPMVVVIYLHSVLMRINSYERFVGETAREEDEEDPSPDSSQAMTTISSEGEDSPH